MSEIYLYENLTSEIIKACYTIHNELGCGFLERVYQEALAIVLGEQQIPYEREKHLPISYHGKTLRCDYIADFVIEGKVIVELKAVTKLDSVYEAQLINYLKVTGLQVGLLINFGQTSLQIKRLAANIY